MEAKSKKIALLGTIALFIATFVYINEGNVISVYATKIDACKINHEEEELEEIDRLNEMQKQIAEECEGVYVSVQGYTYKCDECGYVGVSV